MKQYLLIFLVISIASMISYDGHAQKLRLQNLSLGFTGHSGKFALEGNENGQELQRFNSRVANRAEAKLAGLGLLAYLKITDKIDITYDWNLQYGKEQTPDNIRTSTDDAYTINSFNIGAKYQVYEWNNLFPYVKLAYTNYQVNGLGVYDSSATTVSKTKEYDYRGNGITLGLGMEYEVGNHFLFISYEGLLPIGQMKADVGNVQFENKPSVRRLSLGLGLSLF